MNREELINEFDKQQLEILLNDLQDIDKFTGIKDGAFKYELGKYQANLLVNCIKKQKEVIEKANKKLNNFIKCCKAEKLESGSDYLHHQYWDMFERFNKQIKDILKEVE